MFSSIQSYFYRVQTDQAARRKLIIAIAIVVGLGLIFSFIFYVNTRDRTVKTNREELNSPSYRLVSSNDFDINQGLQQKYGLPVADNKAISEKDGNWAFVNDEFKLIYNGQKIEDSPNVVPRSIYVTGAGAVVNSFDQTYLYNGSQTSKFIDKAYSIVPAQITDSQNTRNKPGYMFLVSNENQIFIFETSDVFKNVSVKQLAQFNLRDSKRFAELRVINQEPYLFLYSNFNRQGEVDVWQITNTGKLIQAKTLNDVFSLGFSDKGFVYTQLSKTPTELSLYETHAVGFDQSLVGEDRLLDIQPRIAQQGIYGTMLAQRCDMDSATSVTCLIKIRKVIHNVSSEQDRIVKYDFRNDKLEFPYQNLFVSGSKILFDSTGNPYIIGQESRLLYQLDQNRK